MTSLLKPSTYRKSKPSPKPQQKAITPPSSSPASIGNYSSTNLTLGAGVAIFHLATARVVLCSMPLPLSSPSDDNEDVNASTYFLPKGRLDVNESSIQAAEREGFEESGFRNRVLPLPMRSRQTKPRSALVVKSRQNGIAGGESGEYTEREDDGAFEEGEEVAETEEAKRRRYQMDEKRRMHNDFVVVPVWTQLAPVGRGSQYILHWYIAETVPPDEESKISRLEEERKERYAPPPPFERERTLRQRIAEDGVGRNNKEREGNRSRNEDLQDVDGKTGKEIVEQDVWYEPVRHEGTGVEGTEEEMYESRLVPVDEAIRLLGERSVSADVVRRGWEMVQTRMMLEDAVESAHRQQNEYYGGD